MLKGKTAIITGGVRGIGLAIADKFAQNGADIVVTTTKDLSEVEEALTLLRSHGGRVEVARLNVSDKNEVDAIVPDLIERMGRVDVLVNNAGITRDALMMRMSEDDWDAVIGVDLKSAYNMVNAVLPSMLKQGCGNIVNISSVVGVSGNPGQCNYAAAKSALIGFSCSLAKEYGPKGIRSNCIAPGFIMSGMTAQLPESIISDWNSRISLRRPGQPEEVANVALFLASEMSSYINAQVINCCGGINR